MDQPLLCGVDAGHGAAGGMVGIENKQTNEKRVTFICGVCHLGFTSIESLVESPLGVLVQPGYILLKRLLIHRSVSLAEAIELLEAQVARDPTQPGIAGALEELRTQNIEAMSPNEFAALMARTNTTNPKEEN